MTAPRFGGAIGEMMMRILTMTPERRARWTALMTDAELFDLAKEQLIGLRTTQAEIAKRHNARQAPAKAVCGHVARDHSGLCCDDELCPNYVPF